MDHFQRNERAYERNARSLASGHDNQNNSKQPIRQKTELRRNNLDINPIHTVFLRNLAYDLTKEDLEKIASEFGEVFSVFSRTNKRGFAFITFYDLRCAQKAVAGLECRVIRGREAHTSYAYSPPEYSNHDPTQNCATITVRAPEGSQVTIDEVSKAFGIDKYGEIRLTEPGEKPNEFTVRYYDLRTARKAVEDSGNVEINGEKMSAEYNLKDDDDLKSQPSETEREREERRAQEKLKYKQRKEERYGSRSNSGHYNDRYDRGYDKGHDKYDKYDQYGQYDAYRQYPPPQPGQPPNQYPYQYPQYPYPYPYPPYQVPPAGPPVSAAPPVAAAPPPPPPAAATAAAPYQGQWGQYPPQWPPQPPRPPNGAQQQIPPPVQPPVPVQSVQQLQQPIPQQPIQQQPLQQQPLQQQPISPVYQQPIHPPQQQIPSYAASPIQSQPVYQQQPQNIPQQQAPASTDNSSRDTIKPDALKDLMKMFQ